jgi:hypothetical protein
MTFTSSMAQAWIEFRLRSIDLAISENKLDSLYSVGLQDLNKLKEFDLIDVDEYESTLKKLQLAVKDHRIYLRALENV